MKRAHILILTFVLLVAVAVGAYIIHDRHNNTTNMGYNGERRNITTFSEYIGDERVVFYPVIETLEAFGAKVQEENDRYIIHVGDKKYILEQNEHPLYDGDAVTLYDTKMPEQNLLLIPPGSYGAPTRKDGDVYVNDATITHVFTQMGLEGYLDEIDVMISESDDLVLTNEGHTQNWMHTECSKDNVKEFMSILGTAKDEGLERLISVYHIDEEHCFNVTPEAVSMCTDIKIFKFSDSSLSLALIDGEVYEICEWLGGYGFFNAVPWDYDEDGTMDLLIASSWGSGFHRSEISVFNVKTKQSTIICTSIESGNEDSGNDWFVATESPSSYREDLEEPPIYYVIYSAEIKSGDSFVDLSYVAKSFVGSIELEYGMPIFHPNKKSE